MQLIDKQLPMAVADISNRKSFNPLHLNFVSPLWGEGMLQLNRWALEIFKLLVQAVLLSLAQKWLLLSLPAVLAVVYIVQKVYLRTSRQLRFLELESRAVTFSSFLESVSIVDMLLSSLLKMPIFPLIPETDRNFR